MEPHSHTPYCADMSRFVAVEVRVTVSARGADIRVRMKPGSACWSDLTTVATKFVPGVAMPTSPDEASEVAVMALREAFPPLWT